MNMLCFHGKNETGRRSVSVLFWVVFQLSVLELLHGENGGFVTGFSGGRESWL